MCAASMLLGVGANTAMETGRQLEISSVRCCLPLPPSPDKEGGMGSQSKGC